MGLLTVLADASTVTMTPLHLSSGVRRIRLSMQPRNLLLALACCGACSRYEVVSGDPNSPVPPECEDRPASLTRSVGDSAAILSITGTARDEHGRPVRNAFVRLLPGAQSPTVTDSNGAFTLRDLTAGDHELDVRAIGFAILTTPIALPASGRLEYRITLPTRYFDGPCSAVVVSRKRWWKWW